ncbi:hypothetical protein N7454_000970 [Penicillium verhagenii]|nr:hypothetical protein N7454_000970 [Penicillium verhagenii]
MFGDKFKEGQEEVAVMEQIDGVLSPRSFKGLLQWLYHGVVNFEPDKPENQIYAAIELVRLGDMCMISQLEAEATRQFQTILMQTRLSKPCELSDGREIRINNYCLERRTIISATFLPQGHEVRRVVAAASVHGYLRDDNHESLQLTQNYPIFGADVLQEVRKCLQTLKYEKYEKYEKSKTHTVRDPLSEYYCTMEI